MRINTNMAALNAWRSMSSNQTNLQKSLSRLSSGYRITNAADDAAGLAVSEKMRAQIRGLAMATRNTQDAVSMVQTAEGGAGKVQDMLQRMRELAVQATSDTLQDADRSKLQEEFSSLQSEIDRTANSVTFNGRKLLDGSSGDTAVINAGGTGVTELTANGLSSVITTRNISVSVAGGADAKSEIQNTAIVIAGNSFDEANVATMALNAAKAAQGGFGTDLDSKTLTFTQNGSTLTVNFEATDTQTGSAVKTLNGAQFVNYVNAKAAALGMSLRVSTDTTAGFKLDAGAVGTANAVTLGGTASASFGFSTAVNGLTNGQAATNATVTLNDGAALVLTTDYTVAGNVVTGQGTYAGIQFTVASGASATIALTRNNLTFQVGANQNETINASLGNLTTTNLGVGSSSLSITSKSNAGAALNALDTAISNVSTERAKMGAMQNRLENTISNLQTQNENLTAAESRIRDVDMAQEMASFTKFQVLSQASTAMLAQANQLSQGILSLLR